MKKILLIIVFLFAFLASCKKSSLVAPVNTFSATIDGVDESFNTNIFAQNGTSTVLNSDLEVLGANGAASSADVLTINLDTNNTLTTGTYTNAPNNGGNLVSIVYTKGQFSLANPNTYKSDINGTYLTTVKITSINASNVQGTFTAQLVYTDGKTLKSITNGKFNVNLN